MPRRGPHRPTSRLGLTAEAVLAVRGTSDGDLATRGDRARPSSVLVRPEAELRRESDGRESWVFRASDPAELLGIHADQIRHALFAAEEVRYLVYSPRWDGGGGPFGVRADPASHAVALTDRRFIISRDTHVDGAPPTVLSIPFEAVLCIESGTALMLGWMVIHFADAGSARSATVLHRAIGHDHFAAAIRAYRLQACSDLPARGAPPLAWPEVLSGVEERHREELGPLLIAPELPLSAAAWPALCGRERRRRHGNRVSATQAGAVVGSTHGVFIVGDDPHTPPGSLNFGVNVVCVAAAAVQIVDLMDRTISGPSAVAIRLHLRRGDTSMSLEVAFPGSALDGVRTALGALAIPPAIRQLEWSS